LRTATIQLALLSCFAVVAWPTQARQDDAQRLITLGRTAPSTQHRTQHPAHSTQHSSTL